MGDALAEEAKRVLEKAGVTVDVVIPVPDTSRVAALQVAQHLGIPYREGFVKNRYIGRTFIMPGQNMRRKNVRRKLNAMPLEFEGKNIMLVDDSIVRGTTSKEIIQMAKDVGAKKVFMASCAPPIRFSNVYGIDMPSADELVAHGRTEEEIAQHIGADLVIFQTLPDLIESCRQFNPSIEQFDCSVFTGEYVTGGVDERYLERINRLRNDKAKAKQGSSQPPQEETILQDANSCQGPMSEWPPVFCSQSRPLTPLADGSDAILGLMNHSPKITPKDQAHAGPNDEVGLHNSWYGN